MNSTTSRLVVLFVLALAFVAAVLAQSSSFYEDDSFSLSSADNVEDLPAMPLGFDEAEQQDFSESDNSIDAQDLFENIEDSVAPQAFDEQVEDKSSEDAVSSLALRSSGSRSSRSSSSRSSSSRSSGLRSSSSSSRSSSGLRSSSSSSRSSSGLRSSSSSRSSGLRSSSSRSTYRSSSSRSRSSKVKVKIVSYKKVKITYPKLKIKYSLIYRNPRPSVYVYGGVSYNTYSKYTLMGEYTLEEILRIIGSAPYVRRTMRIRYMTSTLGHKYLWRNVVIDLTNGNTFIIRAGTPAGSTVITTPVIGNLNTTSSAAPASTSTSVTGTTNAAQTLEYYMEDATEDASVLQTTSTSAEANLTPSSTTVIEPTPTGATPDTNDAASQNDFKAADAITQDQLSVMQVPVYAGAPKSTIISVAAVVIMAAAWLFAL